MKRSVAIIGMALIGVIGFFGLNRLNAPQPFDPDSISDVVEYLTGVPGDTVVASVDGKPVTAEEYLYWVGYTADSVEYYMGSEMDWTLTEGEASILEYIKENALESNKLYRVVESRAEELGCGFNEENEAEYQESVAAMTEQLGGEEEMKKWLLEIGLTEEGFHRINQPAYVYQNVLDSLLDAGPATREEMAEYIEENDILKAKHILLMTIDPATREPLSEEEQAAKKQQAEEISAQLGESGEPLALFDELMNRYSEDTGLAANPDGYTFTANQMVAEFEQGTRDLEYDEISGIIESDYGYHVILRLDPADEAFAADLGQLLGETEAQETLNARISDWMAGAEVVTAEAYDALDIPAYYSNLKALREEIAAVDAEYAASQAGS